MYPMLRYTLVSSTLCIVGAVLLNAADFDLPWYTIDAGGETNISGGDFELGGTIGQPDAVTEMTGGEFTLIGGFWPGVRPFCPSDLDGDGDVDLSDLATLLANYGASSGMTYADGDLDGDGDVDLSDLATLLAFYGATCE